jgi:hypothetical protein
MVGKLTDKSANSSHILFVSQGKPRGISTSVDVNEHPITVALI